MIYLFVTIISTAVMAVAYSNGVDRNKWQGNALVAAVVSAIILVPIAEHIYLYPLVAAYQFALFHLVFNWQRLRSAVVFQELFGRRFVVVMETI